MIGECPRVGVVPLEDFLVEVEYPFKNTHWCLLGVPAVLDGKDL